MLKKWKWTYFGIAGLAMGSGLVGAIVSQKGWGISRVPASKTVPLGGRLWNGGKHRAAVELKSDVPETGLLPDAAEPVSLALQIHDSCEAVVVRLRGIEGVSFVDPGEGEELSLGDCSAGGNFSVPVRVRVAPQSQGFIVADVLYTASGEWKSLSIAVRAPARGDAGGSLGSILKASSKTAAAVPSQIKADPVSGQRYWVHSRR